MIISKSSQRLSRRSSAHVASFHSSRYIDGGARAEHTLRRNVEDLSQIALRQRVLKKYVRFKHGNITV